MYGPKVVPPADAFLPDSQVGQVGHYAPCCKQSPHGCHGGVARVVCHHGGVCDMLCELNC